MAHVVADRDTTASPERVIDALTDFSPKRLDLWPNLDQQYFELEDSRATSAEVKEGSQRLRWSLGAESLRLVPSGDGAHRRRGIERISSRGATGSTR